MANIPYKLVVGRIKNVMKSDGQFDNTQPSPQMTACLRNGLYHVITKVISQSRQLAYKQLAKLFWRIYLIQ